ncbi:DUF234 domain-containing protein [Nitratifractor salsuginis]|uniref:DUF234 domain-containing protein n=1 Tax=Nitratifractor salsuginis (strain DSM 16511 / JCM 12458 / E9I37-1) TaxID=749222 RepID=E6WY31_NITSE|nr:DUF234 domain-containing protein [Nitratifractor salsuginis]ADV46405.1 hypothetical protein Nitsa_1152 [Nitratifractor salsuginis DSM 16511]
MAHLKEGRIRQQLIAFQQRFPYLSLAQLLEYFAVFGGREEGVHFEFFEDLEQSVERIYGRKYARSREWIRPSYLLEEPYRRLLIAVAKGDGKLHNVLRRARLDERTGGRLIDELVCLGVLRFEESREAPLHSRPGRWLPRELRRYRIQDKLRFRRPFDRFWFGFVAPFAGDLERGKTQRFMEGYRQHRDRAFSLLFEQLSAELLELHFAGEDPLSSLGSYWDLHNEFDLLVLTESGELILGECKYKGRPVCAKELHKLREKAKVSGLKVSRYALFSLSGFSRELRERRQGDLLLFELEDFRRLLEAG